MDAAIMAFEKAYRLDYDLHQCAKQHSTTMLLHAWKGRTHNSFGSSVALMEDFLARTNSRFAPARPWYIVTGYITDNN